MVDTAGSIGSVGYFDITSVFLYGKFLTGYIVNLVDGGAWNSEAAGSNPATQTSFRMRTANKKIQLLIEK